MLIGLSDYWHELDEQIDNISEGIKEGSRCEENCVRIMSISGVGPMIWTAMVAFIGKGKPLTVGATSRLGWA